MDSPGNIYRKDVALPLLAECDEDWMTGKIYLNLKD